ncbi:MAG: four helix bundle protein [Candidatus Liptonbacteria bacterium]|nr:four helix bundle protein [Candidatus Liptonbacteria bacterium]
MNEVSNTKAKIYDLEERTFNFAKRVNEYVNRLPKTISNIENGKQLVRSGASVGANYIEANNALGKKDFMMRIRISKKEAKESYFWIRLTEPVTSQLHEKEALLNESMELVKIFGSILEKSKV